MQVTPDHILELGSAFKASKALLSAVELGVFSALAEEPLPGDTLRMQVGIADRGARDFFDALVALGLLRRDEWDRYSNTLEANLYLDRRKPSYIGGDLNHLNTRAFLLWNDLTAALRTGTPQSSPADENFYQLLYSDQAALHGFAEGMTGGSLLAAQALAARFPWHEHRTLIDIGTAQGCLPVQIAQVHPHVTGGGFDLPAMQPLFDDYVREHELSPRLHFYAGDFLKDPLPTADVIVFGRVLHNWDLPTRRLLLKKTYDALPSGGAIIIYERLIDDERRVNAAALLASLAMLVATAGGSNFSGVDCIAWLGDAGFRDTCVEPLTNDFSMVTGLK